MDHQQTRDLGGFFVSLLHNSIESCTLDEFFPGVLVPRCFVTIKGIWISLSATHSKSRLRRIHLPELVEAFRNSSLAWLRNIINSGRINSISFVRKYFAQFRQHSLGFGRNFRCITFTQIRHIDILQH